MTNIYFIRHAKPNYRNHVDAIRELTNQGILDCALVDRFFQGITVDAVLSSPYLRTMQTVAPVAASHQKSIVQIYDFRERQIASGWIDDYQSFARQQWSDFSYRLSDGESLQEVQDRNITALNNVLNKHPDQTIVIGAHGTALSTVIHYYSPAFDYSQFVRIQKKMPWIVHFCFCEHKCLQITEYDLFSGEVQRIL